jgi:hypothetical protein
MVRSVVSGAERDSDGSSRTQPFSIKAKQSSSMGLSPKGMVRSAVSGAKRDAGDASRNGPLTTDSLVATLTADEFGVIFSRARNGSTEISTFVTPKPTGEHEACCRLSLPTIGVVQSCDGGGGAVRDVSAIAREPNLSSVKSMGLSMKLEA